MQIWPTCWRTDWTLAARLAEPGGEMSALDIFNRLPVEKQVEAVLARLQGAIAMRNALRLLPYLLKNDRALGLEVLETLERLAGMKPPLVMQLFKNLRGAAK